MSKGARWATQPKCKLAVAGLAVVSAALMASCSGGEPSASPGTSPAVNAAGEDSSASSATANPSSAGGSFCDAARQLQKDQAAIKQAGRQKAQPGQATENTTALRSAKDAEAVFAKMRSLAPGSVKTDVQTVTTRWKPFFDAIIQDNGNLTKVPASVERGDLSLGKSPPFQALNNYEVHACGFPASGH